MLAEGMEEATQIAKLRSVQLERLHGRSSRCGSTSNVNEILAPFEVSQPMLTARMKKWNQTFCLRITNVCSVTFVTITTTG
jgi:hypothetical protein